MAATTALATHTVAMVLGMAMATHTDPHTLATHTDLHTLATVMVPAMGMATHTLATMVLPAMAMATHMLALAMAMAMATADMAMATHTTKCGPCPFWVLSEPVQGIAPLRSTADSLCGDF